MFVKVKKTALATILAALTFTANPALAGEAGSITLNLEGVQAGGGPLYVAVQKREDFMQERSTAGGIYENISGGDLVYQYAELPIGNYGIMIWHDLDNDGEFSMDESYMPLDGWGASGPELRGAPTFDAVKINVESSGTELTIKMHYPN